MLVHRYYVFNDDVCLHVRRYIRRPESHCRRRRASVNAQADCDDDMDHQSADDGICLDFHDYCFHRSTHRLL